MLSLSPRLSKEDPLGRKIAPTVIKLAEMNVPLRGDSHLSKRFQNRAFTTRRKSAEKHQPFDSAVKVKSIHLGRKPHDGKAEERFEHERTIAKTAEPAVLSKQRTRVQSALVKRKPRTLHAVTTVHNIQFVNSP